MTIPAAAKGTPIPKPNAGVGFIKPDGTLTSHGMEFLNAFREFIVGMNRVTPCSASGTANAITLTPNVGACPLIEKYVDHEVFVFAAALSSTNSVTATVVPRTGTLSTIKVYVTGGSAQAGNGDITAGLTYLAIYNSALDAGAGGLVLK